MGRHPTVNSATEPTPSVGSRWVLIGTLDVRAVAAGATTARSHGDIVDAFSGATTPLVNWAWAMAHLAATVAPARFQVTNPRAD